jgi:outer membrane protein assembly factor BamB
MGTIFLSCNKENNQASEAALQENNNNKTNGKSKHNIINTGGGNKAGGLKGAQEDRPNRDDKIYKKTKERLYIYDKDTGEEKHDFEIEGYKFKIIEHDGAIYFCDKHGKLYAIEKDSSSIKWSQELHTTAEIKSSFPALIHNDILYAFVSANYYALDIASGEIKWVFNDPKNSWGGTNYLVYDGKLYFDLGGLDIFAIDIEIGKGRKIFENEINCDIAPGFSIGSKTLFTTVMDISWNAEDGLSNAYYLHAIDTDNGDIKWRVGFPDKITLPLVYKETAYITSGDRFLYGLDLASGEKWKYEAPDSVKTILEITDDSLSYKTSGGKIHTVPIVQIKQYPDDSIIDNDRNNPLTTEYNDLIVQEYKLADKLETVSHITWDVINDFFDTGRKEISYHSYIGDEGLHTVQDEADEYTYKLMLGDKVLYVAENAYYPFEKQPIRTLYAYNGHWVFEYIEHVTDSPHTLIGKGYFTGNVVVDGENLNRKYGYSGVYNYFFIKDKPFYFYSDNSKKTKLSYDGETLPVEYERIAHYYCCAMSHFNPGIYRDMVDFYGYKDGYWYYVKAGSVN